MADLESPRARFERQQREKEREQREGTVVVAIVVGAVAVAIATGAALLVTAAFSQVVYWQLNPVIVGAL